MPRTARNAPGGFIHHVLKRSVGRMRLFSKEADFAAFQRVMIEAHQLHPIRILAYCILSNHWHFAVWPERDDQVTAYFRWLAHTHAMRWRVAHRTVGYGHLYQGRFKSFPVESDEHLLTVLRYVERNSVGAGLVARAEEWPWSSPWSRSHGDDAIKAILAPWPVERPSDWLKRVNTPLSARELSRIRLSIARGRPYGSDEWTRRTAENLGLQHTIRPEGRPPKRGERGISPEN